MFVIVMVVFIFFINFYLFIFLYFYGYLYLRKIFQNCVAQKRATFGSFPSFIEPHEGSTL